MEKLVLSANKVGDCTEGSLSCPRWIWAYRVGVRPCRWQPYWGQDGIRGHLVKCWGFSVVENNELFLVHVVHSPGARNTMRSAANSSAWEKEICWPLLSWCYWCSLAWNGDPIQLMPPAFCNTKKLLADDASVTDLSEKMQFSRTKSRIFAK